MSENDAKVNTADEQEGTQETESNETGTFTQEQVNKIIAERVARAKERFSDYDSLKEQAEAFENYKASEAERLEEVKREAAEAAKAELIPTFNQEKVQNLIAFEAKGAFTDTSDALLHLKDRTDEFITEDGQVDAGAVSTAVAELLENKPHLAARNSSNPAISDVGLGRTGVSTPPTTNADRFAAFMQKSIGNN